MANCNFSRDDCKVFVGCLPYDATSDSLKKVFKTWEGYCDFYYPGEKKGWATVEFTSVEKRDAFLKVKHRHNTVLNKWADIKEFKSKHKAVQGRQAAPSPSSFMTGALAFQRDSAPVDQTAVRVNNRALSPLKPISTPSSKSGVIQNYLGDNFGVIRNNLKQDVFFHFESVLYCFLHRSECPGGDKCGAAAKLTLELLRVKNETLKSLMPVNMSVFFSDRPVDPNLTPKQYTFQASLVWMTRKSPLVEPCSTETLDGHLHQLVILLQQPPAQPRQHQPPSQPIQHFSSSTSQPDLVRYKRGTRSRQNSGTSVTHNEVVRRAPDATRNTTESSSIASNARSVTEVDVEVYWKNIEDLIVFLRQKLKIGVNGACRVDLTKFVQRVANDAYLKKESIDIAVEMMHLLEKANVPESKRSDIMANFKVYYHTFSHKIQATGVNPKTLAKGVSRLSIGASVEGDNFGSETSSASDYGGGLRRRENYDKDINYSNNDVATKESTEGLAKTSVGLRRNDAGPRDDSGKQNSDVSETKNHVNNVISSVSEHSGPEESCAAVFVGPTGESKSKKMLPAASRAGMTNGVAGNIDREAEPRSVQLLNKKIMELQERLADLESRFSARFEEASIKGSQSNHRGPAGTPDCSKERRQVVNLTLADHAGSITVINTDDRGELHFQAVEAIFPGVNALRYSLGDKRTGICSREGDFFGKPNDGWQDRVYIVNVPRPSESAC